LKGVKNQTMKNKDVAEAFAEGKNAKTKHLYIEGNVIYSYGYHFPIAMRLEDCVLFNSNGYSRTTAKHKFEVKNALSEEQFIFMNTEKLKKCIELCIKNKIDLMLNNL
jgi:hypothetical protein